MSLITISIKSNKKGSCVSSKNFTTPLYRIVGFNDLLGYIKRLRMNTCKDWLLWDRLVSIVMDRKRAMPAKATC